ncbi:hypothetical protein G9C85_05650 [Halorubellus sp. JP-L1]|uniref:hypothetical protein n=1 Tax=Halorubellus sp. JP-L1 TaxID=2715753 RepID=UPI001408DAA8|nr:hypothetical protein [Halorubellus sp. JP-L1]NHN41120.1 hypothetical protein [Halorubellus sp. JP-L1]
MDQNRTESLDSRRDAVVGWAAIATVTLAAVAQFLAGRVVWSGVALLVAAFLALPAVATRSSTASVPWSFSAVAAVAVVLRAAGVYPDLSGYLVVSSVALVLVAALARHTDVELSRRFAVVFATMTTMALQACWIIVQFYADRWLGTGFLPSQAELQWDIVYVVVVSVVLGVALEWSFEQFDAAGSLDRQSRG